MRSLDPAPKFLLNLLTVGVVRARWVARTNRALGRKTSALFAWFLLPFAHYGLAKRLNGALDGVGTAHRESPFWCFWLTGWPIIGATRRLRRGVTRYNDSLRVRLASPSASVESVPTA